jgi:hypothetical protein
VQRHKPFCLLPLAVHFIIYTIKYMEIEFDLAEDKLHRARHGLSFLEAERFE